MNDKSVSLEYANSLVYELEKAMWDERGRGGRYRMTTIGRGFFKDKCLRKMMSSEPAAIAKAVEEVLKEAGIVHAMQCTIEDNLLRFSVKGCIHLPVEHKILEKGIEPFTCLPANLIALGIGEKLDRPVELAQIKVEDDCCNMLLVLFDKRPE
jgi:hypothetical protein